ncbi:mechanosensitive ion channel family protein [bacterium]|nr:mechanosensitive ion channel family protein [bacterium]
MPELLNKWISNPLFIKITIAALSALIVIVIVRLLMRSLARRIKDSDTRYKARKFTAFMGYIVVVMIIISLFSEKLGSLQVALGIVGAGIAFALQEVVSSIAGWFAISFSNFFKTGDRVQLGGIKGDVIDIGILRTTIMEVGGWVNGDLYNGRVVRIANNFVFKEPVLNYSGDFPFLWDEITIPIRFGSNYDLARQIITKVVMETVSEYTEVAKKSWDELVKKYLIENARVEPLISITVDENWVTFTIRYVVDYKSRRITKDKLYANLLEEIEKNKDRVSVASASMDINVAK